MKLKHDLQSSLMTKKQRIIYGILLTFGYGLTIIFSSMWFLPENIPNNFSGIAHLLDLGLFGLISYIVWYQIMNELFYWYMASHMVKPKRIEPEKGLSVAFLTAFVPGSESYSILERTLKAMVAVDYPHDTWLLDEGDDPVAKQICATYNVKHFSRYGIDHYNLDSGSFKKKTKGGNYNSWFDQHGIKYHIVAQVDVDFVPKKNFLTKTLGYFRDPDVAFVGTPQIYGNQDESWITRGAAEQAYTFYGPIQRGLDRFDNSLFIGANHVFRSIAHHDIDGYAGHIVEDHLTGMHIYKKKWKSVYLPTILAVGEGPSTWESYFNQQMRWAYGLIHILLNHSFDIFKQLRKRHLLHYAVLQQYYFYGITQGLAVLLLLLYFIFGIRTTDLKLNSLLSLYIPLLIFQTVINLWLQRFFVKPSTEKGLHLRAKLLNLAVWPIYLLAFICVLVNKKIQYKVTQKGERSYVPPQISLFYPHLILGMLSTIGLYIGFHTHHFAPHQVFFALLNSVFMIGFFLYAVLENVMYSFKKVEIKNFVFRTFI
jgi:cellulose synthase/poly-beta-1,6-N-acetylglucosamine synthase-like glycosyltransferase